MSLFHIISIPLFLIATLEIALGTILLRNHHRKSNAQRAVAAISFFSAAFSFTSAAMYMRASLGLSIDVTARLNWIGWFTVPAGLQILYYLKHESGRTGHIIGLILYPVWLIILGLCLFTDLIVMPGYSVIPFINHPGPLENAARLFGSLLAVWLLYELVRLKKKLHGLKKAQLNYFFQGVLIFGCGAAFTAGFLQIFGGFGFEPGLASFFSLPWVALTYYAITRHRLFDIQLIFSRVLAIVLLVGLFSAIQIGLFKLLIPSLGESLSIVISLSVIAIIFSVTRINRMIQHWVNHLVLQNKYDYQRVLKESITAMVTMLDLDELLGYIIASMKRSLGVERVYLILKEKNGAWRNHGETKNPALETTGLDDILAEQLLRFGPSVMREEVAESRSEQEGLVHKAMEKMDSDLIIPLVYKGDVKGFMVLGRKGNQDPYLQSDTDLLESLGGHAAVAIENAQLYEEARQAKDSMRESEAQFRTLAETAAIGIFIHQGGNFLYANREAEEIGGYTVQEYLAMDFMRLVHPDFYDLVKSRAPESLAGSGGEPDQYEFKIVRKNGQERWVLMTAGISEFRGKPGVIGTMIDITDWKRAEEEKVTFYEESVRQYRERIEEEKKHRIEKEKILMDLHDGIGGITTNISMLSELALAAKNRDTSIKLLVTISQLCKEGIAEIRGFMHGLDSKELNWRTLAAELRSQGASLVRTHNIRFSVATHVQEACDQPGSLTWVNLFKIYKEALTNVIKHSKATLVEVEFRVDQTSVLLIIRDNGVGVRESTGGGRGLSHMRTRAEDIGGSVTVSGGRGTVVKLHIPIPLKYPAQGMVIR